MISQMDQLAQEIDRAKVRLGEDAPIVKALQRQLGGYRSMQVNREQNFLVGTVPKKQDE